MSVADNPSTQVTEVTEVTLVTLVTLVTTEGTIIIQGDSEMTTHTQIDHNSDLSQCFPSCEDSVINPFKHGLKIVKLWIMRSHERKQLAKLDGRMLKDIGVSYFDAKREIEKSFWR